MMRTQPQLPFPDWERRPTPSFGWLDARLLHEEWLGLLGPHGVAVLTLLAIAADHRGASFYRRDTMAMRLSMSREDVDWGLGRLVELGLLAYRPWTSGAIDGVWQILRTPSARP